MSSISNWTDFRGTKAKCVMQRLLTNYVDRFHPAAMLSDYLVAPEILESFRLINGSSGVAEAVFRWFGPVVNTDAGFVAEPSTENPPPRVFIQGVLKRNVEEQRLLLRYLNVLDTGRLPDDINQLRDWFSSAMWAKDFIRNWFRFRVGMLKFHESMSYLTRQEREQLASTREIPWLRPIHTELDESLNESLADSNAVIDFESIFFGIVSKEIHGAIVANALAKLASALKETSDPQLTLRQTGDRSRGFDLVVDGERTRLILNDELVNSMLASLFRAPPGPVLRLMIAVKNFVGAMITADPTFVLRNTARDMLSSVVLGRATMRPGLDTLLGTKEYAIRSSLHKEWCLQGGALSTLFETATLDDVSSTETTLTKPTRNTIVTRSKRFYSFVTTPARALESGTRISQFNRMLAAGATKRQAALASRAVSTDFANRGSADDLLTKLIRTTVFLNAALQGLNEVRKVAFTKTGYGGKTTYMGERSKAFWVRGCLGMTSIALIAWFSSTGPRHIEKYEALSTYHKSAYLHFMSVPFADAYLRIPVPFEVGFLFQKLPEVAFDFVADLDTSDTELSKNGRFPPTLTHIFKTSFLLNDIPVPTAFSPIVDHMRNQNFFGSEIEPYYFRFRPPAERYFRTTPLFYRTLGEWFQASPVLIKHYIEGYGGGVARNLIAITDWIAWDNRRFGEKPFPNGWLRGTGLAAFKPNPYSGWSRWVEDFRPILEEMIPVCDAFADRSNRNRRRYLDRYGEIIGWCNFLKQSDNTLRRISPSSMVFDLARDPSLNRTYKEAEIVRMYRSYHELYRDLYTTYRDNT